MTERLSTLLHEEAAHLDVPAPAAPAVLARGRGLRRRRRVTTGLSGLAVLAVLGGGAVLGAQALSGDGADRGLTPAGTSDPGAVFSIGTTLYFDDAAKTATIDDRSIKSLHYTSAGILVRHGNNPWSDGGGPQRFSLVKPDGTVVPIGVTLEETVHSTEPTQPYLAYAEVVDGTVEVVVRDLSDDTEVARVPLPGDFEWGGWSAPPVALSGDTVYVGAEDVARSVNWRTGEVSETDTIPPGYPDIHGGRAVEATRQEVSVIDVGSGDTLLTVPVDGYGYLSLSPDGRFAKLDTETMTGTGFDVFDVATGKSTRLDGAPYEYGWSEDGDLFRLRGDKLTTCDAVSGDCATTPVALAVPPGDDEDFSDDLKLGGIAYES